MSPEDQKTYEKTYRKLIAENQDMIAQYKIMLMDKGWDEEERLGIEHDMHERERHIDNLLYSLSELPTWAKNNYKTEQLNLF
ncbi:MAG: hypothetical protein [Circular genetic element sp.]|nr:MAG: hypothetical protein [Circular genetic element sp.]